MSNYIPDYTVGSIPTGDSLFDDMPDVFGQSGQEIADWFGFKDPEKYSEFFNPVNIAGIREGMSKIPDTRNFLFSQNQDWYTNQRRGILNKLGRTGLAGSNQQSSLLGSLNQEYGSKMFSSERQVQDLVQGYQDQLSREISNLYGSAGTVLQSGAELGDGITPTFGATAPPTSDNSYWRNSNNWNDPNFDTEPYDPSVPPTSDNAYWRGQVGSNIYGG